MNKRQRPKRKKKGAAVAAVLCFVAAIAIVGTYTFSDYRNTQREEKLAQAEDTEEMTNEKEESEETSTKAEDIIINTQKKTKTDADDKKEEQDEQEKNTVNSGLQPASAVGSAVNFSSESKLLWPVNGAVIMNYSMDKTVYFSTLDQYKYNPAVIIDGAEGDQVICGAPGVVKSIDVTAETGTTVNVDIGNGYELFYGQLKEVPVKVGDHVEAKTVLGYVSQPTKYYSVEGCNVYFEMRKDGQPVDPMGFLE